MRICAESAGATVVLPKQPRYITSGTPTRHLSFFTQKAILSASAKNATTSSIRKKRKIVPIPTVENIDTPPRHARPRIARA